MFKQLLQSNKSQIAVSYIHVRSSFICTFEFYKGGDKGRANAVYVQLFEGQMKGKEHMEYTHMNMYNSCNIPIGTPLKVKIKVEYKMVTTYRKIIEMEFISETNMYMYIQCMLRTNLEPAACFKAGRPILKPSRRF